ncbi:hypothetical protein GJAV_G00084710 [Gymnothorax javanicus]|nr:hypothetical protein GJAV_G00084710 [Gymnothorax javanicus]
MKKALQLDEAPSIGQGSLICQSSWVKEPERESDRPLIDLGLPFKSQQSSLLSLGCGEQMNHCSDNGENTSSRGRTKCCCETTLKGPLCPGQAIGAENGLHRAKLLQLFSTPSKRGCSSVDGLRPPAAWPAVSGLRVMGSFKKLRSSVLQGIQSRAATTANQEQGQRTGANHDTGHGIAANQEQGQRTGVSQETGHGIAAHQEGGERTGANQEMVHGISANGERVPDEIYPANERPKSEVTQRVPNGLGLVENLRDERGSGWEAPNRTSSCSQSLCMAREVGGVARLASGSPVQPPAPTAPRQCPVTPIQTAANPIIKSRLSTSADNLHFFRGPFKRKPPIPEPGAEQENPASGIKRTASTSSVAPGNHGPHVQSVLTHVQKLVSSMTDLSVRQRSGSTAASSPSSAQSALSRLHDDYSRRAPCLSDGKRQRRHLRAQNAVTTKDFGSNPGSDLSPSGSTSASSQTCTAMSVDRPSEQELKFECSIESLISDAVKCEDGSYKSSTSATVADAAAPDSPTPAACAPIVDPRASDAPVCTADPPWRRVSVGRTRPRPQSDYGQVASRRFSVPEELAERTSAGTGSALPASCDSNGGCGQSFCSEVDVGRCAHGSSQENCDGRCEINRSASQETRDRKQRPISVLEGVDLYNAPCAEEKEDMTHSRPPLPSHQLPPYRGVSVRLRPCLLSQSTPIGLDRLGQPRLLRILSADGGSERSGVQDDSLSEEDCSFDELSEVVLYLQPGAELSALNEWISSGQAVYAEALWDHVTMEEEELAFKAGDVIRVLDAPNKDWWWGATCDRQAWFPSSFVRVRVNQEDAEVAMLMDNIENVQCKKPAPGGAVVQSSAQREQMRTNVVNEIMNTERVYIKHLKDICEGYLRQCRKHTGMFTQPQLSTIFGNIEEIYRFQRKFLKDLERHYDKEQPHQSQIGSCFLLQQAEFSVYSEYCNNHPHACVELQRLMKLGRYRHFFEACRLLQQMIDISIAGFLLTPVQKICKYPLQLGELLKYTPKEHRDHGGVSDAYEAMKKVACLINERKRRLESLDTIAHWQETILRWEGEDVLSRSSELIHSGDLTRILPDGKTQQRVFFLFDHQMVFCKKDVLRRDLLFYRGRLDTDRVEVLDVPDGRDAQLGLSLKNAFRLRDGVSLEEYIFCAKKAADKHRWLQAFTDERRRVREDQEMGMEINESQRNGAILRARKSKRGKLRNASYTPCSARLPLQPLHPLQQRHVTVPTSVPQQPVFSLAEPKRKPSHLWDSFTRHGLFRK